MSKYEFDRKYSDRTLKILFGTCNGFCAYPGCTNPIIAPETGVDGPAVSAQIAHIHSVTSKGPRPYPGVPLESFINGFDNLLLLCGYHHGLIDDQENSFTVEQLREWKDRQCGRSLSSRYVRVPTDLSSFTALGHVFETFVENGVVVEVGAPEAYFSTVRRGNSVTHLQHRRQPIWVQVDGGRIRQQKFVDTEQPARSGDRVSIVYIRSSKNKDGLMVMFYNHSIDRYMSFCTPRTVVEHVFLGGLSVGIGLLFSSLLLLSLVVSLFSSDVAPYCYFAVGVSFFSFLMWKAIESVIFYRKAGTAVNGIEVI